MNTASPYWQEVNGVLDRIVEGRVFEKVIAESDIGCAFSVVQSVPASGWYQRLDGRPEDQSDSITLCYADLRDNEESPVDSILFQKKYAEDMRRLNNYFGEQQAAAEKGVASTEFSLSDDIQDWIVADHHLIARYVLVNGFGGGFFMCLFNAYRSGLMPVGWLGDCPDGDLLVINPQMLSDS
ncbi:MAG: hypothetical protein AAF328_10445 [Planctomycetota bacterium]